jgi:hypothetical protein
VFLVALAGHMYMPQEPSCCSQRGVMGYANSIILKLRRIYYFYLFFRMAPRQYFTITLAVFVLVALLHALRILYGWDIVIGGWLLPIWGSWVALVVAIILVTATMKLLKKRW